MSEFTLGFAARAMNAMLKGRDNVIKDIKIDSRDVRAGSLFIALKGAKVDGHDYLAEAEKRGAIGAVVSRPVTTALPTLNVNDTTLGLGQLAAFYRASFQIPMTAVTGSFGKTTTKEMLASILAQAGSVLSTQGNLNTDIGLPLTLLRLLPEHQFAVLEMGARKHGDIAYLMKLAVPEVALLTNAGFAHREMLGGEEGIAKAKGEIFECLKPSGTAVINANDVYAEYWQGLLKAKQRIITFGIDYPEAPKRNMNIDILGSDIVLKAMQSCFELKTDMGSIMIELNIPGLHMVKNAVAAAAAARALGISLDHIQTGLSRFLPVPGRLTFKKGYHGISIIDDTYNANPVSMQAALSVLARLPGRLIFVMGDMAEMGKEALQYHEAIGVEAKKAGIHALFGLGPLTAAAVKGFGNCARHYPDKASLIKSLFQSLGNDANMTVLVKGSRFMRMEEVVLALTQQEIQSC